MSYDLIIIGGRTANLVLLREPIGPTRLFPFLVLKKVSCVKHGCKEVLSSCRLYRIY
jgi:hypothetical protein